MIELHTKYKYKVVKSYSRTSCSMSTRSKYKLKYRKGTLVKAVPGTLGIFVFKTKLDALAFINSFKRANSLGPLGRILRVLPLKGDIGKKPKYISMYTYYLKSFYSEMKASSCYKRNSNCHIAYPPNGTLVYPAVYVVD
jgi:hypothetical protein